MNIPHIHLSWWACHLASVLFGIDSQSRLLVLVSCKSMRSNQIATLAGDEAYSQHSLSLIWLHEAPWPIMQPQPYILMGRRQRRRTKEYHVRMAINSNSFQMQFFSESQFRPAQSNRSISANNGICLLGEASNALPKVPWEARNVNSQFDSSFAGTCFVQVEGLPAVAVLAASPYCHSVAQSRVFAMDGLTYRWLINCDASLYLPRWGNYVEGVACPIIPLKNIFRLWTLRNPK